MGTITLFLAGYSYINSWCIVGRGKSKTAAREDLKKIIRDECFKIHGAYVRNFEADNYGQYRYLETSIENIGDDKGCH